VRWARRTEPEERSIPNEPRAVARWAKRMRREASGPIVCAYEAGPTGYALQRQLRGLGLECRVIAPSLIPSKPGERIKTDRRDARKLAELLAGGLLTEVHPPSPEDEAVRDLSRAREDAKQDLLRARHRLSKFLLRHGLTFGRGRRAHGPKPMRRGSEAFASSTRRCRPSSTTTVSRSTSSRNGCARSRRSSRSGRSASPTPHRWRTCAASGASTP
jgi:hypothetical protein